MGRIIFLIFIFVPLVEIAFFVVIGQAIGLWPTLLGVLVTAILGSLLLRHQGLQLWHQIRASISRGELPARALAEGMMVGIAGVLMVTPGYFTDLLGVLLLIPPVRLLIYEGLKRRITFTATSSFGTPRPDEGTIELDADRWRGR